MKIVLIIFLAFLTLVPLSIINADAVSFRDRLGYIPEWAPSRGESQTLSTCMNIDYNSRDFDWCTEFAGYVTDKMMGGSSTNSQVTFRDYRGYIPEWAPSMGESQALSTCTNLDYNSRDFDWCTEFAGYVTDKMMGNVPSNTKSQVTPPQVQESVTTTKSQETTQTREKSPTNSETPAWAMGLAVFIVIGLPIIVIALIIWKIKTRKKNNVFKI